MKRARMLGIAIALCGILLLKGCSSGLTLEQYEYLYVGMSHHDAMEIIGSHATRTAEVGSGEFHTVSYSVEGSGSRNANAIVVFQGDPLELKSKAQSGLR